MPDLTDWSLALPWYPGALLLGYLLGSIPCGLILTRLAGLGDVRSIGSGNIGATNVLRTGNKKIAALTLAGDLLKGTVAVVLGSLWGADAAIVAGFGAFLGHLFPVWLKFRGGKGVATYIGILLGLFWKGAIAFCLIWLAVAFTTRFSSLAALVASAATPFVLAWFEQWQMAGLFAVLTLLLYARHYANITRLLRGTETKIGRA